MTGNVWEWCVGWFDQAAYRHDPTPARALTRVVSWALREAAAGLYPASDALDRLQTWFWGQFDGIEHSDRHTPSGAGPTRASSTPWPAGRWGDRCPTAIEIAVAGEVHRWGPHRRCCCSGQSAEIVGRRCRSMGSRVVVVVIGPRHGAGVPRPASPPSSTEGRPWMRRASSLSVCTGLYPPVYKRGCPLSRNPLKVAARVRIPLGLLEKFRQMAFSFRRCGGGGSVAHPPDRPSWLAPRPE